MAGPFVSDFKRFFLRGLAAVLPTVLTIAIIVWLFTKIQELAGQYINIASIWLVSRGWGLDYYRVEAFWGDYLWWVGFLLAIVGVYIFGYFVASFVGRTVWRMLERMFFRMPVVKQIYPSVKQITDFFVAERKMEFSRVVAVEYPRKGMWSMGLVTGPAMQTISRTTRGDLVTVFVPSSPTPVTGYTITVSRDEIIDLPISIDEAFRFAISGGLVIPQGERPPGTEVSQASRGVPPAPQKEETPA